MTKKKKPNNRLIAATHTHHGGLEMEPLLSLSLFLFLSLSLSLSLSCFSLSLSLSLSLSCLSLSLSLSLLSLSRLPLSACCISDLILLTWTCLVPLPALIFCVQHRRCCSEQLCMPLSCFFAVGYSSVNQAHKDSSPFLGEVSPITESV